jgi:two-component system nitrate/nitrite sensor histidine kinase NarQ
VSYKQIKWLILTIPTLTIGLWEYVRHEFLLPYISMELGNWLAPVIVFLVSVLFLTKLFDMMERYQKELEAAKALKAAVQEREKIARELHDGIAQSLFLLNVQIDRMEKTHELDSELFRQFKENVHRTNAYVRQAIADLRHPAGAANVPWMQALTSLIEEIKQESDLKFAIDWRIPEDRLTAREKVELLASIREALLNIYKHAAARHVRIEAKETEAGGWQCQVTDDGRGFDKNDAYKDGHYGIKMMEDRAKRMNWQFAVDRQGRETVVSIRKEVSP